MQLIPRQTGKFLLSFNTASGKRVHATVPLLLIDDYIIRFNTASCKRVHATLCPGALVGQALKMGFWSRNVIFDRFCHFRTCAPVVFPKGNRLQPFPIKGFRHSRPNWSGFCESAKFSRFCTQFTDIYILPEFNRFFNPFHKKTAAQLSLRGRWKGEIKPIFVKSRVYALSAVSAGAPSGSSSLMIPSFF